MTVEAEVCDFCRGTPAPWTFPAKDFTFGPLDSIGGWAACQDCKPLVEAKEWETLAEIALRDLSDKTPILRQSLKNRLLAFHQEFDKHRTGNPYLEHGEEEQ